MKKIITLFTIICMCLISAGASADNNTISNESSSTSANIEFTDESIEIITVNEPLEDIDLSQFEPTIIATSKNTKNAKAGTADGKCFVGAYVIRSGITNQCQLYLAWSGTAIKGSLKWTSLVIRDPSLLNSKIYKTFWNDSIQCNGTTQGSQFVGYITIPSNISTVQVSCNNMYYSKIGTGAGWYSLAPVLAAVKIN